MKKFLAILMVAAMLVALVGCGQAAPAERAKPAEGEKTIKILFTQTHNDNSFMAYLAETLVATAAEYGAECVHLTCGSDESVQLSQIEQAVSSGEYDAIIADCAGDAVIQGFKQAREAGIRNIHMMYSGLFKGGIKNSSLSRLKMDAQVGDTKALSGLAALLRENGDMLYPGVYWGRVHGEYAFNKLSQAARKHDGDPAQMYVFGESILKRSRTDHPAYLLAPGYLIRYTEKVMKNLEGLQLDGINLFDVGNTPVGDHKRNANVSRISAISTFEKTLEQIGGKYSLILDNPLLYAFRYTTDATNLPDGDNGFAITDASIPFLQWVLDGNLSYSSASWNVESYLGIRQHLLWAMESKSSPRFTFTWEEPSVYANTEDADYLAYFSVQYEDCLSIAAECYQEYNAYYQLVKDAQVVAHQIYDNGVRTVTYDNGVQVYLNYGKTDAVVEGVSIPAGDYVIKEGV